MGPEYYEQSKIPEGTPPPLDAVVRLACYDCDRDDYDPTFVKDALIEGWTDITPALASYESNWWTHLGYCPECRDLVDGEKKKDWEIPF